MVMLFLKHFRQISRKEKIERLFNENIIPLTNLALTRKGLIELYRQGELILFESVKPEIGIK
jgi:hypothetical protein